MSVPYMQLYVADYMADTRHLTCEQDGAYMRLLMAMWRSGGSLPTDPSKLARITGLSTSRWTKICEDVLAFFEEGDGFLTQRRLTKELKKAEEKSTKRSEAGKSGATAKALKNNNTPKANAEPLLKHYPEPEPEPEPKDKTDDDSASAPVIDHLGWPSDRSKWIMTLIAETSCADTVRDAWPFQGSGIVVGWHETDGFEWQDVLAGIRGALLRAQSPPRSWRYFGQAIAQARKDRTTPTQEPTHDSRSGRDQTRPSLGRSTAGIAAAVEAVERRRATGFG